MSNPFAVLKKPWTPHQYQLEAVKFLVSRGGAGLFLDPGLGKTSTVLAAFQLLRKKGMVKRMLVIAPRRVMYLVWPAEIELWEDFKDIRYCILHGDDKDKLLDANADVFIINPEGLPWLTSNGNINRLKCDILTVDELTKFKHTNTQRFKCMKPYLPRFQRRWGMTGTPAPNGLLDLFGQCYMLDMGAALGRFITHYRNTYFYPSGYGGYSWTPQIGAEERILERIKPLALRMQAEDYLQLPELVVQNIEVQLPPSARRIYDQMEEYFISQLGDVDVAAVNAAAAGIKCRQIADGAVYGDLNEINVLGKREFHEIHDAKLDALESLIEELNGQPALVLYAFDHDRERIQKRLGDVPCIGGGTGDAASQRYVQAFNGGSIPVLLAHPASAGHGLNLQQVSNHIVWFGLTWDLELYDQAFRRIYRQGNPNTHVFMHHIIAKDTIDEVILKVVGQKDRSQRSLLAALKGALTSVGA